MVGGSLAVLLGIGVAAERKRCSDDDQGGLGLFGGTAGVLAIGFLFDWKEAIAGGAVGVVAGGLMLVGGAILWSRRAKQRRGERAEFAPFLIRF
jgi:hypothetical protein